MSRVIEPKKVTEHRVIKQFSIYTVDLLDSRGDIAYLTIWAGSVVASWLADN